MRLWPQVTSIATVKQGQGGPLCELWGRSTGEDIAVVSVLGLRTSSLSQLLGVSGRYGSLRICLDLPG